MLEQGGIGMMHLIDISSYQKAIDLPSVLPNVDGVICKATEGIGYVDAYCDRFVQVCRRAGKPWGFYHFAYTNGAIAEAEFFYANTKNYFGEGIPVLDWEGNQSVEWVNEFVRRLHELSGVWCWIYANPWRFNQGGVEPNCMRWVAQYPAVDHPTFATAEGWDAPCADGLVGCWQFCHDGRVAGYGHDLDCSLFYGDTAAWNMYAGLTDVPSESNGTVLENDRYKVTIDVKE